MTVSELIKFLKKYPKDMLVVQEAFSDYLPLAQSPEGIGLPEVHEVSLHGDGKIERYYANQFGDSDRPARLKVLVFQGN